MDLIIVIRGVCYNQVGLYFPLKNQTFDYFSQMLPIINRRVGKMVFVMQYGKDYLK